MPLINKKIVICRRPEQAQALLKALRQRRAWPILLPTFRVEPLAVNEAAETLLLDMEQFQWLALGSENGVAFFRQIIDYLNLPVARLRRVNIALVGQKTAAKWQKLMPGIPVAQTEHYLQDVLNRISEQSAGEKVMVLNPTSRQSLQRLNLQVPPNVELVRVPIYQTVANRGLHAAELDFARSGAYDAIFFGSPTAFDYFRQLVGDAPLRRVAIAAIGNTTRAHIETRGFPVAVVPAVPDTIAMVAALEAYFKKPKKVEENE